jgi:N-acetylglutamate synthase-like GNAT family acetyltransferase
MIRKADRKDLPECSRLICQTIREIEGRYYSPEIIAIWLEHNSPSNLKKEADRTEFVVYEEAGMIIGVGAIEETHLKTIYVLPAYQGKGIGRLILKNLEQIAKDNGVKHLELNSTVNALNFYKRMGYQEQGFITIEKNGISVKFTKMIKHI